MTVAERDRSVEAAEKASEHVRHLRRLLGQAMAAEAEARARAREAVRAAEGSL